MLKIDFRTNQKRFLKNFVFSFANEIYLIKKIKKLNKIKITHLFGIDQMLKSESERGVAFKKEKPIPKITLKIG